MKVDNLIKLILVIPKNEIDAKTSEQISKAYFRLPSVDDPEKQSTKNTFIRRQIDALDALHMLGTVYGGKDGKGAPRYDRYYIREHSLLKYFMNSKVALNVIWANNVMKALGPAYDSEEVFGIARSVRMNQREKVLAGRIRMVPDGIAREYAEIHHEVLKSFLNALEKNHAVMLRYHDRQGNITNEIMEEVERTVLGLVAKDGTIYSISCKGSDDMPQHIPLHRISEVIEIGSKAYARPDFVLDDYIAGQHQLSHVLQDQESPIKVVLKVAPEALFHFQERPITGDQEISKTKDKDGRYTVSVNVPFTVQLPPFIWSHAGWVEVVSPPALRKYVGERLLAAAEHYRQDVKPVR